ncbi:MAG: SAM-dependent methyltransferase [Lacisediminihabitans sp.]
METSELVELLSADGLRLLDSLPPYESTTDVLRSVSELRRAGHSPGLVAAVLSQSKMRARASAKFGPFAERMLFTEAGLEQATRLRVAALHAGRFHAAGLSHIADLGCGIGADAMAMAALEINVTAVEIDEVTAAIASYNLAPWTNVSVVNADAVSFDLGWPPSHSTGSHGAASVRLDPEGATASGIDGVWLDPARRAAGHQHRSRLTDPADFSPSLDFAFGLGKRLPTGVKLGPGIDRDLIPVGAEAQWVSVNHEVVELGVWFGTVARPGIRRAALVLGDHGSAEITADADSEDVEVGPLGEYLYEPDGAVIRARLIGELGHRIGASMASEGIAYLTSDTAVETPFASCFRILETFPFDEKLLRRELSARKIGSLEIKKRGVDVDPARLRTKLSLKGGESATLIVTRVAGKHVALLADRVLVQPV